MTRRIPSILLRDDLSAQEMLFQDPEEIVSVEDLSEVVDAFRRLEEARRAGAWIAGIATYEAGYAFEPKLHDLLPADRRYPLLRFGLFDAPVLRETQAIQPGNAGLRDIRPSWSFEDYAPRFVQLHQHLRQGDCYQANLTFPLTARWEGTSAALFDAMTARQPVHYSALVDLGGPIVLSRSPELFFETRDGWIETHPMKGTVRRGTNAAEDRQLADFLRNDAKNQAENRMIVDLLRNDISRISETGTLQVPELFRIESYPTVHQMVSTVRARLMADLGMPEIFAALFPCGSITGAPKLSAMRILNRLEGTARDAYCGAIGFASPDGHMRFNVAIRTLTLYENGEARFNVGGGIVFDSEARAEYEECLLKARFASATTQG